MAQTTYELNVSTSAVTVPIMDDGREIGSFRFNPTDVDLIKRFEEAGDNIRNAKFDLEASDKDTIFQFSDFLKEQLNYMLGFNCADEIFRVCNPLSPCENGDLFIEVVMDGISSIIEQTTGERLAKKKAKIQKATAKYHK